MRKLLIFNLNFENEFYKTGSYLPLKAPLNKTFRFF
jgi:hypothetical protein